MYVWRAACDRDKKVAAVRRRIQTRAFMSASNVTSPAGARVYSTRYQQFLDAARKFPAIRTAIVHPCDVVSLASAMEAMEAGLIVPVLIGPEAKIRKAAADAG